MPTFDVISEVDKQELDNALNQARKEVGTRFDFKNANPEISFENQVIKLSAADKFKVNALREIVIAKLAKRGIDLKNIEQKEVEVSPTGHGKQDMVVKQGLEGELAKRICKDIKGMGLKVQAQNQEGQVRVSGKSRDDLQSVIAFLRGRDYDVGLSFKNMRD